jgi:hypothetical protein
MSIKFSDGADTPMVTYWVVNGEMRCVDDLSREELLVAIKQASRELQAVHDNWRRTREMHAFLNRVREQRHGL